MPPPRLLAAAAPLLTAWPVHAAAGDTSAWAGSDLGGVAVLAALAAVAWHQLTGRLRQPRHAMACARAPAQRRARRP
jgi:hypothetical protein